MILVACDVRSMSRLSYGEMMRPSSHLNIAGD